LAGYIAAVPLLLYLLLDLFFSFTRQKPFEEKILSTGIYPLLHVTYGAGFLLGLSRRTRKFFFQG
jgi:hypothetical protein